MAIMLKVDEAGGGNIKIKRVDITKNNYINHIINSIDVGLSQLDAGIIINNLVDYNIISEDVAKILKVATNDKVLNLPSEFRDDVRSRILKNVLVNLI